MCLRFVLVSTLYGVPQTATQRTRAGANTQVLYTAMPFSNTHDKRLAFQVSLPVHGANSSSCCQNRRELDLLWCGADRGVRHRRGLSLEPRHFRPLDSSCDFFSSFSLVCFAGPWLMMRILWLWKKRGSNAVLGVGQRASDLWPVSAKSPVCKFGKTCWDLQISRGEDSDRAIREASGIP